MYSLCCLHNLQSILYQITNNFWGTEYLEFKKILPYFLVGIFNDFKLCFQLVDLVGHLIFLVIPTFYFLPQSWSKKKPHVFSPSEMLFFHECKLVWDKTNKKRNRWKQRKWIFGTFDCFLEHCLTSRHSHFIPTMISRSPDKSHPHSFVCD